MVTKRLGWAVAAVLAIGAGFGPAQADIGAGSYLAARHAGFDSDFEAAADFYTRAMVRDPSNISLMESALTAYVALGEFGRAVPIAKQLGRTGTNSQIANLALLVSAAGEEDWQGILDDLENGASVGPLFDGLLEAWSLVGLGNMGEALVAFDQVGEMAGVPAFSLYHKALALAAVGDFEGADAIFVGESGLAIRQTRSGTVLHAEILAQLDRHDEAVSLLESTWTSFDRELESFHAELVAGETRPFRGVTDARQGVAEINFSIAGAVSGEAADGYTLLFARSALFLHEDHIEARMLTAQLLENLERYALATEVYDAVPRDNPAFYRAEMGRASALHNADQNDAAIEVLRQLGESHAEIPTVFVTLGDLLRRLERFEEAEAAYDKAVDLLDEPNRNQWPLYFARAISRERIGDWENAEADFRKALELEPGQPQVLNYLGYSFVEMRINLDEALDMIEQAAAAEPDSGYIIDSLGWVLYRFGRYEEALVHMERAASLMAVDPVVNDHLGDVYWAVGRYREAEFQWHRALSFIKPGENSEADPDRIRRKLELGLDEVLKEEGAPPIQVANDDG